MVQNELTVLVDIKDHWLNRLVLWVAMRFVRLVGVLLPGQPLSGLESIHFAHWAIIPNLENGRKTLLFMSNYDGSWEKYIHDFSDRASFGLDLIWKNCDSYPEGGAKDIDNFKASIRTNEVPASVFYSAYPTSTTRNNKNNLRLRELLTKLSQNADARELLKRL